MHERPTALELAKVPFTDRGIGWQADATAVLKEQAAEIAALRNDAERYRWLAPRMLAADFDYGGEGTQALVFEMPAGFRASADCDATIDDAMGDATALGG